MYEIKRTIISLDERDNAQIDRIFGKQVGLDMEHIPPKQMAKVENTRLWAMEHFTVTSLYQSEPLAGIAEDQVTTASGQVFHSKMMGQLLKDADGIVGIASALHGLDEGMEAFPKITDQMYLDGWATAVLSAVNVKLRMQLKRKIEEAGFYTTATWSPGQHGFDIHNQIPFFELFHPEEIDIHLKETLMMSPQKSETMLFGISRTEQKDSPPPCAFCPNRSTCPDAFAEEQYEG